MEKKRKYVCSMTEVDSNYKTFTFHLLSLFASQKKQCYGIVYREQRDQLRYATSWREDIDTVAKNIRTVFMYKANVSDGPISINMG